jgi:organic radical activating enzyme
LRQGSELKLVYPQQGVDPAQFAGLDFQHFFLQPMDGPDRADNTNKAIAYCQQHPQWRLGIQSHKMIGIR